MKLLIDAGNTRIKWACVDEEQWLCNAVLPTAEVHGLLQQMSGCLEQHGVRLHDIVQIWVSNVAGAEIAQHICNLCASTPERLHFVAASSAQCGVRNGYFTPSQLGSDRWAALIAAWHLVQGKCLVVNSGTATTIDALSAQGKFLGGLIVPGVELMQRNLTGAIPHLQPAHGEYAAFPLNSADALYSGALQANCGAIERQYGLLGDDQAPLLMSGGAAELLRQHLDSKIFSRPPRVIDKLVLQGLLLIAAECDRH